MINELFTNMRNQHLCISYITRGYSNQILLCCSIIRQVSTFIQVKWKPAPLPPSKKNNKKTKTKTKQINKQRQKQKDKKQTKRYYVTFQDHLICVFIHIVLYQVQFSTYIFKLTGYIYIVACNKQQKTPTLAKQVVNHLYISNIVETKT